MNGIVLEILGMPGHSENRAKKVIMYEILASYNLFENLIIYK